MNKWNELDKIIEADDLHIAPFRDDGKTYGTPTWIWCVSVDGELYVRAYNGTSSRWYGAAMRQKRGKIQAAGKSYEVAFEAASDDLKDRIDEAYRKKYANSPYLPPMISDSASVATVRILPV